MAAHNTSNISGSRRYSSTNNSHTKWQHDDSLPASSSTFYHRQLRLPLPLLLLLLLPCSTQAFCPSKCQCLGGDANSRALCVDAALEDVPIQLNPETKYINLTLNRIRNLEFTLPFYMKLEVLDLSQNIIETLGSKNFEYQTELRTLNLSRNLVSALHKHAFKGLTNLLLLDLSYNRIETVHPTALGDLAALVELDLTNNNIVSLEENCFKGMLSLEVLVFRNNRLLDIPASNLWHLHALKSLDMSDNLVEYVRNDSFEGLKELLALAVRGNVMSELDVGAFEGLISLKHLDLSDNNLTVSWGSRERRECVQHGVYLLCWQTNSLALQLKYCGSLLGAHTLTHAHKSDTLLDCLVVNPVSNTLQSGLQTPSESSESSQSCPA